MTRIALATYQEVPRLGEDDRLVLEPLAALGVTAQPAIWDAVEVPWAEFVAVVVRSCWDYHRRLEEFLSWIARLERLGVSVWNPPALLRWNSDKAYLRDLAAAGVATVPTRWLNRGESASLGAVLGAAGWPDAVVKPGVSASAHRTWRASARDAARDQARFEALLADGDVLVQPYLDEIRDPGEWSLLFLGGEFSHAVLQRPAPGDFRVQVEYGGSAAARMPPPHLIAAVRCALAVLQSDPLYARVDGVERQGQFVVSELELIEPHLFLGTHPAAPGRFAQAIAGILR